MSLRTSSRPLIRTVVSLRTTSSTLPPWDSTRALLPLTSTRTLFNPFRRKRPEDKDKFYDDLLKKSPTTTESDASPIGSGGLASSSIFDSPDAGPQETRPSGPRKLANTAAVLDPQPRVRVRWERKMVIRSLRTRGRLGKTATLKRMERESLSKSHLIKTSVKKLNMLGRQISGKTVDDAIVQMRFSKKKAARAVLEHLRHAKNEAIVRRGMGLGHVAATASAEGATNTEKPQSPILIRLKDGKKKVIKDKTQLYVDQAWVSRGKYGIDYDFRARGNVYFMKPPNTSLSVIIKEEATRIRQYEEREKKRKNKKVWVPLPNRPINGQRQYFSW